jgi:hypothetical protein
VNRRFAYAGGVPPGSEGALPFGQYPPKFGLFIKSALLEEAARPLGGPPFGAHLN